MIVSCVGLCREAEERGSGEIALIQRFPVDGIRRLRAEETPVPEHRRVCPLAQRSQASPQPKLRKPGDIYANIPQEKASRTDKRSNGNGVAK